MSEHFAVEHYVYIPYLTGFMTRDLSFLNLLYSLEANLFSARETVLSLWGTFSLSSDVRTFRRPNIPNFSFFAFCESASGVFLGFSTAREILVKKLLTEDFLSGFGLQCMFSSGVFGNVSIGNLTTGPSCIQHTFSV